MRSVVIRTAGCTLAACALLAACGRSDLDPIHAGETGSAGAAAGSPNATPDMPDSPAGFDSLTAVTAAHKQVSVGRLVAVHSDSNGALTKDGLDLDWGFTFFEPVTDQLISAGAYADGFMADPNARPIGRFHCSAIMPLDSRKVVPDAVQRLEQKLGKPFDGNLFLDQNGCVQPPTHQVMALLRNSSTWFFARYQDNGSFIDLIGPCQQRTAESCLADTAR